MVFALNWHTGPRSFTDLALVRLEEFNFSLSVGMCVFTLQYLGNDPFRRVTPLSYVSSRQEAVL